MPREKNLDPMRRPSYSSNAETISSIFPKNVGKLLTEMEELFHFNLFFEGGV